MAVPVPRDGREVSSAPMEGQAPATGAGFGRRLAALARARWPQVTVFLFALFAIDLIRNYSYRGWKPEALISSGVLPVVVGITFLVGGGSVTGTLMAEAFAWRGSARAIATVALALVGAALSLGIIALWIPTWLDTLDLGGVPPSAFVLRNLWYYSATSMLFSAFFATRERDVAITRAAQAAELERGSVQRILMESRLKVIQARVEPELLFDVLADVQRLYASAPADAEALLDDLIVYLRAALPQMRSDTSTLGREAALAEAFLNVTSAKRAGRLACTNGTPPELEDVPFPPMVLLPLVHAAADAGARRLVLDASVSTDSEPVRVSVRVTAALPSGVLVTGWQSEPISALREIVRSYFGEDTRLDTVTDGENLLMTLSFTLPRSLMPSK